MNWNAALAVARKDAVECLRNHLVLTCVLLPVALSLVFKVTFDPERVAGVLVLAVHDPGRSALLASLEREPQVRVEVVQKPEELRQALRGRAQAGLSVPAAFTEDLRAGRRPEVLALHRGSSRALRGLIERHLYRAAGVRPPATVRYEDADDPQASGAGGPPPFTRQLAVLLVIMALGMSGPIVVPLLLTEEKERKTLKALLVTPAGPSEIVLGKAAAALLYGLLAALTVLVLNDGLAGDWPVTLLAVFLGALFVVATGLVLGAFLRTTAQANTWSGLVLMALIMPTWFSDGEPQSWLAWAARAVPTHHLAQAMRLALRGQATAGAVAVPLLVLLVSALATLALAAAVLRRLRDQS